jgi:YVTN family beta-propeller protein
MSQPYRALAGVTIAILTLGTALAAEAAVVVVLNSGDASVSLIDPATHKEIRRFEVGKEPHHLMATPDGQTLIVANAAEQRPGLSRSRRAVSCNAACAIFPTRIRLASRPTVSDGLSWPATASTAMDVYSATGADLKLARAIPAAKTPSHIAFSADSQYWRS